MTSPDEAPSVSPAPADEDPRLLYDKAPCGYLSTAPDGTIVRANETFLTWTGYTGDDLVGRRSLSSLLSAGGRIYHDTHYAPLILMSDHAREIAFEIVTASGSRLPVLLNAALDRDEHGDPHLIRIVMLDATERRGYERELLHAKERAEELARTLERTLLPADLPDIPGLEVAAAYRPAGGGGQIGGDFYDVFQLAEDDWVAVLGDVCGKGVDAAILTSLVRHTTRAAMAKHRAPDEALAVLDEVLRRDESQRFCTVALLRVRRTDGEWHVSLSLGGHPLPLLLEPGSPAHPVGEPGPLVGVFPSPKFTSTELVLDPGSTLLLFTDGITEAGQGSYGEARLLEVAAGHAGSADSVVQAIVVDALEFQGGPLRDDVAVLAIRAPEV